MVVGLVLGVDSEGFDLLFLFMGLEVSGDWSSTSSSAARGGWLV